MTTDPWPPLITAQRVPGWVRVRDLVLTLAAWVVLLYWVRGALLLIGDWLSYPFFELSTYPSPDWPRIWSTLAPFAAMAAVLAAWLVYWAAQRRAILMRQRAMAQPAPLDVETHARQFGLQVADIRALRAPGISTAHFEPNGAISGFTSA